MLLRERQKNLFGRFKKGASLPGHAGQRSQKGRDAKGPRPGRAGRGLARRGPGGRRCSPRSGPNARRPLGTVVVKRWAERARGPRPQGPGARPTQTEGAARHAGGPPLGTKNATRWPAAPCSPTGYPAVPSALGGLTSGFGMGPGVPPPPWPPAIGWHSLVTGARGCPQGRTARNGTRLSKGRT